MHIKDQIYPHKNTIANNIASRDKSCLNSNPVKKEKKPTKLFFCDTTECSKAHRTQFTCIIKCQVIILHNKYQLICLYL